MAPALARQWRIDVALAVFRLPCGAGGLVLETLQRILPYAISLQGGDVRNDFDPGTHAALSPRSTGADHHARLWHDANMVVANSHGLASAGAPGL